MAPKKMELVWRQVAAEAFRKGLFEDFADDVTPKAQRRLLPPVQLEALRDAMIERLDGPGHDGEAWNISALREAVLFQDFLGSLHWDALEGDLEAVRELAESMEHDREVEGGLGGVVFLFDEVEWAVYVSPEGVIHPGFDYDKVCKAADAHEERGPLAFGAWFLRRI